MYMSYRKFVELEEIYISYINKIALLDADKEINEINTLIKKYSNDIKSKNNDIKKLNDSILRVTMIIKRKLKMMYGR